LTGIVGYLVSTKPAKQEYEHKPVSSAPATAQVQADSLEKRVDDSDSDTTNTNTIKIASFNIQVFGKSKRSKKEVMAVLTKTVTNFDITAIQELRDKS
jgi:hypothetical protein